MYKYSCVVMVVILLGFGSVAANANDFSDFISDGQGQGFGVYWNWKMWNGELVTVGAWVDADGYVYQEALFNSSGYFEDGGARAEEFSDWAGSHGFSINGGSWGSGSPCATFLICDDRYWMQV